MPKDIKDEPKKKMVVVEEVEVDEPKVKSQKIEESEEVKEEKDDKEVTQSEEIKKEDETPVQYISENNDEYEDRPNYLWIIIPTALLVGALVGGLITYFSGLSKLTTPVATATPVETSAPVATATPVASQPKTDVKRDTIKLQVLNGSGTAGFAGKAKTYLEGLGYVDVVAGNAPTSDFEDTVIAVKESKKDLLDIVKADLSKNYQVNNETEVLAASSKYDFVITLGKK